jgi:DNA invertase Pin-like site-specific DNA recombinase
MATGNRNVYAYLRVSGLGQVGGDGFERQLVAIKQYAEANGLHVAKVFKELGVSGATDLEGRAALRQMLEALASNGARTIIIERLDRLARDLMVQENLLSDLRKRGFDLISVAEPDLCSSDPSRVLVRQVFGSIAQYDRAMVVAKLRGARERMKARTGRCEGRKPYGTREGEVEIVRRMQELRGDGLAVDKIAAILNLEGLKPRAGKVWYATSVYRVLKAAKAL